ncbi:MAG: ankyrin repeat domain-containing protein [Gemmatimonadota bacterium]|nr:ankyrin repeat domain-containing protein [Gemmatimonadota bacterium]
MGISGLLTILSLLGTLGPEAPIADAAMRGDTHGVRTLIEAGADVNAAQGDGMTGLHWAARLGDPELATVLLDAGARTDVATRIGAHTPLHVATAAGRAALVNVLLRAGSEPDARTTTGATALQFAAASGDVPSIEALVFHGADVDAREPEWGQTPLMFAAAAGRAGAIESLIAGGADPSVTARVLDIVERNRSDAIEQRGGEPPIACSGCLGNYADLVGTHGGLTALLLAAREGHEDAVFALVAGGAHIDGESAADRTTPLLMAMINGHFDLGLRLLAHGANPRLASDAGATPLYAVLNMQWAPKARHPQPTDYQQQQATYIEVMTVLLETGVDPNARLARSLWFTTYNRDLLGVDRTGATPFWRAAHALDVEAMRLLLAYGADPTLPTIKAPTRRQRTEDHSGLPPVPDGGPAVSPIHAASGVGYGQGFAGNSHRHVPDGWLLAMKFLVEELGADVNARDHNGYSPAHHAAARGDNELIRYLVEKGADVTLVARSGQTTVDMANGPVQRIQPFPETIALLEGLGAKNNHRCVSC